MLLAGDGRWFKICWRVAVSKCLAGGETEDAIHSVSAHGDHAGVVFYELERVGNVVVFGVNVFVGVACAEVPDPDEEAVEGPWEGDLWFHCRGGPVVDGVGIEFGSEG